MNDKSLNQPRSGVSPGAASHATQRGAAIDDLLHFQLTQRINLQRRSVGLPLQALADATGLSAIDLGKIEQDQILPSIMMLPRIAAALGKPLEWFYAPLVRRISRGGSQEAEDRISASVPVDLLGIYTEQLRWIQTVGSAGETEQPDTGNTVVERKSGRVLLVDDTPDVLVSIGAFLEGAGLDVTRASSGDEALRLAVSDEAFDVVITDHAMPGLSGVDLLAQLTAMRSTLSGIIITAYMETVSLQGLPEGTVVLRKPFRRALLIENVRRLIHASTTKETQS